jgi:hypothetical protein
MRLSKLLAASLLASAASLPVDFLSAQDPAPAGQPQERTGLSDLESTVNQLLEEENDPASADDRNTGQPDSPEAGSTPAEDETQPESPPEAPESQPAAEPATAPPLEEPAAAPAADASPQTPPRPAPPLTRAERAEVDRIAERGRLLIAIARAGILATQDMLTRVSDPDAAGIDGWIAEPEGNAVTVTFYAEGEAGPAAVYRATVLGPRVVSRETHITGERPPLTPLQARMAAARAATEALDNEACTPQPFNVLVVPPAAADGPIDVYQTSAPAQRGVFPLGGHFRSTVAADGSIADSRRFANSCVDIEASVPAAGEQPRPIGVTHLLDPMPTEMHVFLSQLMGRPILVATGEPSRIWLVTGERIVEVRE